MGLHMRQINQKLVLYVTFSFRGAATWLGCLPGQAAAATPHEWIEGDIVLTVETFN